MKDAIDATISECKTLALAIRHEYLNPMGWVITSQRVGESVSHIYKKDDEVLICEHDAVDYELGR